MIYNGLIHSPSRERNKSSGDCLYLSLALPWFKPLREAFSLICHACMASSDLAPYPGTEAECSMERHGTRCFLQRGKLGKTVVCFTWKQWNLCRKCGKHLSNHEIHVAGLQRIHAQHWIHWKVGNLRQRNVHHYHIHMLSSPRDSLYWSI